MKWKKVKLTEISNPKQWKNLPISELSSEGYPVYGANGIIGKYKEYNHEFPTLAVTCRGATCGTINITEPKSYITSNAMALDNISEDVDQNFLYYALNKRGFKDVITGAAQPQITREGLSKIVLDIPENIKYQLHIANILSKAENLISQRRESIALLDKFLKSTFLEMFGDPGTNPKGWDLAKLEDSFLNKPLIGSMVPAIESGTIPIVRVGEIGNREINFAKCKFSNLNDGELKKYLLKSGDILLARAIGSEAHLGKASIYIDSGFPVVYDSHVMRIRFKKEKIHPEFFYTFLQTQGGRKRFMRKAGQTSIQFNVNSKQISDIDIPVPPIELQNKFAEIAGRIEALKTQYKQSLTELENLYGVLSQKAFKGELKINTNDTTTNE
jgi:type I restriction enzyme S subunit